MTTVDEIRKAIEGLPGTAKIKLIADMPKNAEFSVSLNRMYADDGELVVDLDVVSWTEEDDDNDDGESDGD